MDHCMTVCTVQVPIKRILFGEKKQMTVCFVFYKIYLLLVLLIFKIKKFCGKNHFI